MKPDSTNALFSGIEALARAGTDASPSGAVFPLATPELGPVLLKLGLGLIAIIGLILLLQRLARRFGGGLSHRGEPIQVLAQRPIGPRISLAVIEVMDRTLLIGVSPQGVHRVADLSRARVRQAASALAARGELELLIDSGRTQVAGPSSWKERTVQSLARLLVGARDARSRKASAEEPPALPASPVESGADFEAELSQRLSEIQARYPKLTEAAPKPARGVAR